VSNRPGFHEYVDKLFKKHEQKGEGQKKKYVYFGYEDEPAEQTTKNKVFSKFGDTGIYNMSPHDFNWGSGYVDHFYPDFGGLFEGTGTVYGLSKEKFGPLEWSHPGRGRVGFDQYGQYDGDADSIYDEAFRQRDTPDTD